MKFEEKPHAEPKKWVQCPDYEPFTFVEKLKCLFIYIPLYVIEKNPIAIISYPFFMLFIRFSNCKKVGNCKNRIPLPSDYYELLSNNCEAGEYI